MKFSVLLAAFFVAVEVVLAHQGLLDREISPDEEAEWRLFKNKNQKKFRSKEREQMRKVTFVGNLRTIKDHNANSSESSYKLGVNPFADWTQEELARLTGEVDTDNVIPAPEMSRALLRQAIPDSVDLRQSPCMPPVKSQGMCGSCYTFAAVTPMEYQNCMKTGKLVILSEENLIDCSQKYGNAGCDGGLALRAWNYVKDIGINTENSYPYEGEETFCTFSSNDIGTNVTAWAYATRTNDEEAIKVAVALYGPVAVSIDAAGWEFYSNGVFSNPSCSTTRTNHAVVIVGYGKDPVSQKDYWIVRNSWGDGWGLDGYIYLERGVGMCAVGKRAVYPTVF